MIPIEEFTDVIMMTLMVMMTLVTMRTLMNLMTMMTLMTLLASQDALEVMRVTDLLSHWTLALTLLM